MTGAELKALAKDAGLTAKELADRIGVSSGTMSRYCQAETVPLHIELASRYVTQRPADEPVADERPIEVRLAELIKELANGGKHD